MFKTKIGTVHGTYEVAYLQNLINKNKKLPTICHVRIKTPFGTYLPDFEYKNKFIEIKSKFTLDVAKGLQPGKYNIKNKNQWEKIQWVNANIKKVEIIIPNKKTTFSLFKQAIINKFILDKIEIKNNQYKKIA